ncbi:MAG: hypothetical protein LBR24_03495 [Methanobrevibacter sp.]|jgi:uncharacterized UPF0146 family protein|nr:hypothetical protein [Methanobrevibacter sp.]
MWEDLGEYILKMINNSLRKKIVEIGVGKFFKVGEYIEKMSSDEDIELLLLDIAPANDKVIFEDVENPNWDLYDEVGLVYSIRPPYEIQPFIDEISLKTNSKLIIKPLFNEDLNTKRNLKLKSYKKAVFYEA